MRFTTSFWPRITALLGLSLGLGAAGCEKEQSEKSAAPVASIDKAAAIDPALAKAVAATSSGVKPGAAPSGPGQPPLGGIFAPGAADREAPRGAPPKLTLGGTGSEPRVKLGPTQPKPGTKTAGTFEIIVQADQNALPVSLGVVIEALKPKSEGTEGAVEPVGMSVKITGAKLGVTGVPAELEARFAKLKGSKIEYRVDSAGAGSGYHYDLPAGAEETRDHLRVLADVLALVTLPMPTEPVGQGAMWMVASREGIFGLDLVTYRLVSVDQISADAVTLSVGAKRYATSNRFDFEGLPKDAPRELAEFDSKTESKLLYKVGAALPSSGDIDTVLVAQLAMPGQQRGIMQIRSRVALDLKTPAAR